MGILNTQFTPEYGSAASLSFQLGVGTRIEK